MADIFTKRVRDILTQIPIGMVMTYGIVATYAGNSCGARQVARILHSSSEKYGLPWHRVVNKKGQVSPRRSMSHLSQRKLLEEEGVVFDARGKIDLSIYLWIPDNNVITSIPSR